MFESPVSRMFCCPFRFLTPDLASSERGIPLIDTLCHLDPWNCMRKNFQKTLNRQRGETSERVAEKGSFFLGWVDVRWVSDSDTASTQELL